jgi:hypothetical protein
MSEILKNALEHSPYILGGLGALAAAGGIALQAAERRTFRYPSCSFNGFDNEARIAQLQGYAEAATTYIRDNHIGAVALMDTAARPFYVPLIDTWNEKYNRATDPRPPIFFLNPQGFRSKEYTNTLIEWATPINALRKGQRAEHPKKRRDSATILDTFVSKYPQLYARRDMPTLLIDSCLHTGNSAAHVMASLQTLGFKDVRLMVGYLDPAVNDMDCAPDVVLDDNQPLGACYPFGIDTLVRKTYASPNSLPSPNTKQRRIARRLRQTLHAAMQKPTPSAN